MRVGTVGAGVAAGCVLRDINVAGGGKGCGKHHKDGCEYNVAGSVQAFLHESCAGLAILAEPAGQTLRAPVGEWLTIYWMIESPL